MGISINNICGSIGCITIVYVRGFRSKPIVEAALEVADATHINSATGEVGAVEDIGFGISCCGTLGGGSHRLAGEIGNATDTRVTLDIHGPLEIQAFHEAATWLTTTLHAYRLGGTVDVASSGVIG